MYTRLSLQGTLHKIPLFLALIPPALILLLIQTYAVNVIFWDEWEMVPLIVHLHTGELRFSDFLAQQNEHRIIVPRFITVGLAALFGWNVIVESYLSFVLASLQVLVLWRLIVATVQAQYSGWLAAGASWLVFSAAPGECWIWGILFSWFLTTCAVCIVVWLTSRESVSWWSIVLAALAALVATFSHGGGMLIWIVALLTMIVMRHPLRILLFWVIAAVAGIGLYFVNYTTVAGSSGLDAVIANPPVYVAYLIIYLATALGATTSFPLLMAAYGIAGWLGFILLLGYAISRFWNPHDHELLRRMLPWMQLMLFAVLNAAVTGVGRMSLGLAQATSTRYAIFTALYWVGLIVVLFTLQSETRLLSQTTFYKQGVVALALLLTVGYCLAYVRGLGDLMLFSARFRTGLAYLYDYERAPDQGLLLLYPDAAVVRQYARQLEQVREGPFRDTRARTTQPYPTSR